MNPVRNLKSNLQLRKQDINIIAFVRNKRAIVSNGVKKIFRPGLIIFMLSFSLFASSLSADSKLPFPGNEPEISLDFKDVNLKDLLKLFSIQSGLNFIASEGVQDRKVTLYLDKVPLKQAMDKLFKANNLSYELDRDSNIFIVKDWGRPEAETETRVFYLKHATVSSSSLKEEMSNQITSAETMGSIGSSASGGAGGGGGKWAREDDTGITRAVKKLLSPFGSVIEDFRTNSLIVRDIPSHMPVIVQVIASLDVRVPQVLLEVEMLDVSKNTVDKLGVNWPTTLLQATIPGSREINLFGGKGLSGAGRTIDPALGIFGGSTTQWDFGAWDATKFGPSVLTVLGATLTLDFLRSQTDTKFLARPKLLTLNNETAEIRIATDEAIGVTQTQSGTAATTGVTTATAERSETGIILRVTPQINTETGEVTMFIYPKVSEAVASTLISSLGTFRDPEERSTKTLVRVKDGETVILGGLIRNEYTKQETKLPILGDIPIIGALFRHKGGTSSNPDKDKTRELLVFITPRIIKDADIKLAQTKKAVFPEREQNTASGFNRELAISSSLNGFEKK
jgi:type IV pilus assembly protein PilQ